MISIDFSMGNHQEAYDSARERLGDTLRSLKLRFFRITWRKIAQFHETWKLRNFGQKLFLRAPKFRNFYKFLALRAVFQFIGYVGCRWCIIRVCTCAMGGV